ncbi:arabinan endo-1,5-alpha-L-arabinosidase [Isoptericola sp. CG 20/1183]|uniref:Arabinan endo-1,5-alpha-L-arabinosidase n=1 Tax=Isoptericola halotolerans TaxID=300560 RepID=A0ABX5EDX1_9MICO|nr:MULTISPECIES: arabinan endo-1,5-alpha-L-arabinosidase [Isoptericola]PRZ06908.1 arabinan endo-1,5-alpha-L-arabinosidase [Isoptericola halotolerans]PRZ07420.1 arabinan endo-1,5-alpha-L-arabinosidase [Isoptericola sp. CG 20/1183]
MSRAGRRRRPVVVALAVLCVAAVAGGIALGVLRPWAEPATEPRPIALDGDLATHDPALVVGAAGEPWFVYSTGVPNKALGAPVVNRSDDGGATWEQVGPAWGSDEDPQWVRESIEGVEHYWAPELVEHDGTWYLYFSASTFGSNTSAIGLATGSTLDPADPDYGWTHRGAVWRSQAGDTYNAIDPGVVEDADGNPWLFFGSFWDGIHAVPLEWPSGMPADGAEPVLVASRGDGENQIEAPYVVERDGWYYLFVSWGKCCSGVSSTYSIQVGRSRDVTGPYLDAEGRDMADGGGTEVLASDGSMIGPGGQSVSQGHLGYHFYDGDAAGAFRLAVQELGWSDGWPVATPEVPVPPG